MEMTSRVLIVDDEPSIVAPLNFLMEQEGCEVQVLSDGAHVLPSIRQQPPDLILLDVMLPSRSGYEICEDIRNHAEWDSIKIIMLTVRGREADVEKGLALGADDYITKPFAIQEVIDKVRSHLERA